jgi:hypothetical protein
MNSTAVCAYPSAGGGRGSANSGGAARNTPRPGLNEMPLHARKKSFAVVQRQPKRIEGRMGIGAATASDFMGLLRSISAAQF